MPLAGFGVLIEGHSRDIHGNYDTAGTAITSSGTADTFGSWVELIADVGDKDILITKVEVRIVGLTSNSSKVELDIGTGAASSETTQFSLVLKPAITSGDVVRDFVSRRIPASSRLSARIRDQEASTNTAYMAISYITL